jgi:hypothetical protein
MRRAPVLVTLLAVVAGTGALASTAAAAPTTPVRPNTFIDGDGSLTDAAIAKLLDPSWRPAPVDAGVSQADLDNVLNTARGRAKVIPPLKSFLANNKVLLGSAALVIGSDIAVQGYTDAYHLIKCHFGPCTNASTNGGGTATATPVGWNYVQQGYDVGSGPTTSTGNANSAACNGSPTAYTVNGWCAPLSGWYLSWKCAGAGCQSTTNTEFYATTGSAFPEYQAATQMPVLAQMPHAMVITGCNGCLGQTYKYLYESEEGFERDMGRSVTDAAGWAAAPTKYTTSYNQSTVTIDKAAGGAVFGTPGSQDPDQAAAENAGTKATGGTPGTGTGGDPGTGGGTVTLDPFVPFVLPKPQPWETYDDYLERLRAKGWVGTITPAAETDATTIGTNTDAGISPLGVTALTVATGPEVLPRAWPTNPPKVPKADTAIALKFQPFAAAIPPAPACNCPPVDGINLTTGDHFPFGVWNYISGVYGQLAAPPVRPDLTLPVHVNAATKAGGTVDDASNLHLAVPPAMGAKVDTYAGEVRTWIGYGIWISTFLWLGFWFFKLQHPALYEGDEASDDRIAGASRAKWMRENM